MSETLTKMRAAKRRMVELSSGAQLQVRALGAVDFLETGKIPSLFELFSGRVPRERAKDIASNPETLRQLNVFFLTHGVCGPEGIKVVDKQPSEVSGSELSVHELEMGDVQKLVNEIRNLSGLPVTDEERKEAAAAVVPFREEQAAAANG